MLYDVFVWESIDGRKYVVSLHFEVCIGKRLVLGQIFENAEITEMFIAQIAPDTPCLFQTLVIQHGVELFVIFQQLLYRIQLQHYADIVDVFGGIKVQRALLIKFGSEYFVGENAFQTYGFDGKGENVKLFCENTFFIF